MPRKKKKNQESTNFLKRIVIFVLGLGIIVGSVWGVRHIILTSQLFEVKTILIDPALQIVDKRDLSSFKGKNIFEVDINRIYKRLSFKYPQISELKVKRQFPNRILIVARKRFPIAQIYVGKTILTLDQDGVVLSKSTRRLKKCVLFEKLPVQLSYRLGEHVKHKGILAGIKIIEAFRDQPALNDLSIESMKVDQESKIELQLNNEISVIMDETEVRKDMKDLSVVLLQSQLDLKEINYVDLRFRDPHIGKKKN